MSAPGPVGNADYDGRSLGELVSDLSSNASRLMRQEVELAKTEIKHEAAKAGKGAGMLGGAALAGLLALIFLSLTVVYALDNVWDLEWAALVVTLFWAVVAAVLAAMGRNRLKSVDPRLDETAESLKEDARWVKAQTS